MRKKPKTKANKIEAILRELEKAQIEFAEKMRKRRLKSTKGVK